MNLPALTNANLPAHLQHLAQNTALMNVNQSAALGISAGGWPRISIKGGRFRLQSPDGEEFVVPQLHLDVIVIDANPHQALSKVFFATKYDPNAEERAPDCFSDNGVGPSVSASKPQSATCAACPNNVIGSRISEAGSATKACGDYKKVAVLMAENTSGPVFELRMPYMSLKNWKSYIEALNKNGVPASTVVTRLEFDTASVYPKLVFKPAFNQSGLMPYINEAQANDVMDVIGTDEVDLCTGKNDRPIDPASFKGNGVAAPVAVAAPPAPLSSVPPTMTAFTAPPNSPPHFAASENPAGALPSESRGGTPSRRTRRSKPVDIAQPPLPENNAPPQEAVPPFLRNARSSHPPQNNADVTAPLTPKGVTNAALDEAIAKAMSV